MAKLFLSENVIFFKTLYLCLKVLLKEQFESMQIKCDLDYSSYFTSKDIGSREVITIAMVTAYYSHEVHAVPPCDS